MPKSETTTPTIAEAVKLLKVYGCKTNNQDNSPVAIKQLRKALLMVAQESEWENIGICADNLAQGLDALKSYLEALGYSYNFSQTDYERAKGAESVYIKFNTRNMSYYADSYTGNSRGVLVAMQGEEAAIVGTYGYFPLNLFIERYSNRTID